jgi:uncharacterized membrane protein YbhN (UPF0104 family)
MVKIKLFVRIVLSSLLIGILSTKVDWMIIFQAIKSVDIYLYAVSTLFALFSSLFVAWKYYLLIKDTSISHSIPSLIKINLISRFYALFMPTSIGREAVRWFKVTHNQKGRALFLASTIFERLTFLFILLIFGLVPLFFYSSNSEIVALRMRISPIVLISLIFIFFCITYFMFQAIRSFLNSIINNIFSSRIKYIDIGLFLKNFALKKASTSLYAHILLLCIIWQIIFISRLFILIKAAELPLGFIDVAWMASLVLVLQVLPISFAGIGIREGGYAYLFTMFNLPQEKGVLIGILFFSQMLIMAGIGATFNLFEK